MSANEFDFGGWATKNDLLCADGRTIRRNAFKDDDGRTVPLVYQHDHNNPTNVLGHVLLENRDEGLYAYGSLNNTAIGQHVKELIRHGDVNALSIYANKLTQRGGDVLHGTIREVSVVLAGANPGAVIEFPLLEHGEESETEAYIWSGDDHLDIGEGLSLAHSEEKGEDGSKADDKKAEPVKMEDEPEKKDPEEEKKEEPKAEPAQEEPKQEEPKGEETKTEDPGELSHADNKEDDDDETVQDVLDSLNKEQKAAVDYVLDQALQGNKFDAPANGEGGEKPNGKSIADVLKTLNEKQQKVVEYLLEQAQEAAEADDNEEGEGGEASHSEEENEEDTIMHGNLFEKGANNEQTVDNSLVLTHAQMDTLIKDAKRLGSLKASVLEHSAEYGIDHIDYLMPEYREVGGEGAPAFIKRDMGWVSKVMNGVHKTPFSKIKTTFADLTEDEARAKGYIKGKRKKEEVFSLLKRTTSATTIYKKQKLDRDDVIEITSFDVVAWLKGEMRFMLDEEIARAILIGDGRSVDSDDHIDENCIRPILREADLFVVRKPLVVAQGQDKADALIDTVTYAWEDYQGSGNCVAFMARKQLSALKLLKDKMGRRLYSTEAEIASVLGVREIICVPQLNDASTVRVDSETGKTYKPLVMILNLDDYNVGADKGGAVNMFDDFDIDYNQMKYLIETRCSGALIKPFSAIIVEEEVNPQ